MNAKGQRPPTYGNPERVIGGEVLADEHLPLMGRVGNAASGYLVTFATLQHADVDTAALRSFEFS